jgi:hypothetical protein
MDPQDDSCNQLTIQQSMMNQQEDVEYFILLRNIYMLLVQRCCLEEGQS